MTFLVLILTGLSVFFLAVVITEVLRRAYAEYEEKYLNKHWKEDTADLVRPLIEKFEALEDGSQENVVKEVVGLLRTEAKVL